MAEGPLNHAIYPAVRLHALVAHQPRLSAGLKKTPAKP